MSVTLQALVWTLSQPAHSAPTYRAGSVFQFAWSWCVWMAAMHSSVLSVDWCLDLVWFNISRYYLFIFHCTDGGLWLKCDQHHESQNPNTNMNIWEYVLSAWSQQLLKPEWRSGWTPENAENVPSVLHTWPATAAGSSSGCGDSGRLWIQPWARSQIDWLRKQWKENFLMGLLMLQLQFADVTLWQIYASLKALLDTTSLLFSYWSTHWVLTQNLRQVEEILISDEGLIEVLLCVCSYKLMLLEGHIVFIATAIKG